MFWRHRPICKILCVSAILSLPLDSEDKCEMKAHAELPAIFFDCHRLATAVRHPRAAECRSTQARMHAQLETFAMCSFQEV